MLSLDKNNFHKYSTKAGNYSTRFGASKASEDNLSKRKRFFHLLEIKKVKFIAKVLTGKEKLAVIFLSSIALMALIYLAIAWVGAHSVIIAQDGGDYIEGIVGSPGLINPLFSSNNETDQDITWLIFNGLLKNEDGKLVNDLAERYTVSDDGLSYTFSIRKDVVFHDGAPLTADDIVFTVEAIQNPQTASTLYKSLSGFKAEKKDDYTVIFKLNKPFAPFLSLISFGILPKHILESIPPQSVRLADFNIKTPIGTGPFKIKSFKKDNRGIIKSYTLSRNNQYYTHPPRLSTITLKFFADTDAALDALRNKNIDGISYLPTKYQTDALKKKVDIRSLSLPQYTAIFFNQQKNPYLANASVRKAITLAINREKLVEKMGGQAKIIYGPILDGFVGYHPDIKKYDFNAAEAEKLLVSAGWKKISRDEYNGTRPENQTDQNFFWQKDDDILTIKLTTSDNPETGLAATIIKKQWETFGIRVEVELAAKDELLGKIIEPRNYETLLIGQIVGSDPDPYAFWHSSQILAPGANLALYKNEKVDALLEEARKTANLDEREKKYIEFQNLLKEDAPAIFLYSPTYPYAITPRMQGITTTRITIPADRFDGIENWYLKTKRVIDFGKGK